VVSSGLGQRFPAGYPVGRVTHVNQDSSQPFAEVRVEPTAQLNRSRYLLLVFSPESAYGDVFPSLSLEPEQLPEAEAGETDSAAAQTQEQPQQQTEQPQPEEQGDAQ